MDKGLECFKYIKSNLLQFTKEKYWKLNKETLEGIIKRKKEKCQIVEDSLKVLELIKKLNIFDDGQRRIFISGEIICKSKEEFELLKKVML